MAGLNETKVAIAKTKRLLCPTITKCKSKPEQTPTQVGRDITPKHGWQDPKRPLRVAADCAGLDSMSVALKLMGLEHELVFASENNNHARKVLEANAMVPLAHFARDILLRNDSDLPEAAFGLDLYTAGPPCQPFSKAGLQNGFNDSRGVVFLRVLQTIENTSPRLFLENAPTLKQKKFDSALSTIKKLLGDTVDGSGWPFYKMAD